MTRYNRPFVSAESWRIEVRDGESLLFEHAVPYASFSRSGIAAAMVALQMSYRAPDEFLYTFAKPSSRYRREFPTVVWSLEGASCGTTPTVTLQIIAETLTAALRER